MIIESSAPTRVDLAGSTIDIPPLFLFHEGSATVNFAISLMARCRIETRDDDVISISSTDRGESYQVLLSEVDSLRDEPRLELLAKLVYFFRPESGFNMITESEAPAGAGLAGSSTLNIACIGALNALVGNRYSADRFIQIAANVECQVIKVPTGYQDYYSAQYGGAAAIHFRPDGIVREALEVDTAKLRSRIAICYTGEPRDSGINNWELTKRHIDGDKEVISIFDSIRDNAVMVREAIIDQDWDRLGELLREAYPIRKQMSPNLATPHMEELVTKAYANGAIAAKICGAGGGGCIAFFCEEGRTKEVEKALSNEEGAEILDWSFSSEGLTIRTEAHA
ncbi:hypothetical protein [Leptolyngbya sp. 7M]|uniref:GHMP family kinase ATP-binding protein n=1 Tax=Leptolyngbya sp. 7M TaxID=2812896 RepID=UPI001B8B7063|nr:hypothetical protein [Leptolyngbya sp. 7M]QYO65743.1 hypothetical protein JVX88_02825 [Leptolyngbya sp. 7M]